MIGWGHRTSKCVQVFKQGWGHCTGREQLGWGHRTTCKAEFQDFTTYPAGGWLGGPLLQEIMPLRGSILQVGTCQILSLAENPRWSRVWQYLLFYFGSEVVIYVARNSRSVMTALEEWENDCLRRVWGVYEESPRILYEYWVSARALGMNTGCVYWVWVTGIVTTPTQPQLNST